MRVSSSPGEEKLVSRRQSGQKGIRWIIDSTICDFRLYAASQPDRPIDSVKVSRDLDSVPIVLGQLATEVMQGKIEIMELLHFIAAVMPHCLRSGRFHEIFSVWERRGFHVTPVHSYQPIPDTQSLPESLWDRASKLAGIDMNDSVQADLLRRHFPKFRNKYGHFPTQPTGKPARFYLNNGLFDDMDALVTLLHGPSFPAAVDRENWRWFFLTPIGASAGKEQQIKSYLHRAVSAGVSSAGVPRVTLLN